MRSSETRIAGKLSVSRALSDSLHEKSWEGNLANMIFQAISIIPGFFLSSLVVCCASGASPGAPGGMELGPRRSQEVRESPELQNCGLRALLLDGRVLDTSGEHFLSVFPSYFRPF